jgi:anti-sigma factor RsiW
LSHLGRRLSAWIDGELDSAERDRVLVHLARCEPCRGEAAALRTLKRRMSALGEAAADSAFTRRLMGLAQPGSPFAPG